MNASLEPITIILPVYGRSELLVDALTSILSLDSDCQPWKLYIADDGSDIKTQCFLEDWLSQHGSSDIFWMRRPRNLGLFANLNLAIAEVRTSWILLLCSDDLLLPQALVQLRALREEWPSAGLILSTFESISSNGATLHCDSGEHHDKITDKTSLQYPETFVPLLLRLGSLNGNLSGMAFSRETWLKAGPFKSEWRHAADWEWLIRSSEQGPILLNRSPIARVRTHENQLSNTNRNSGHELAEVASVVKILKHHKLLLDEPRRQRWASEIMQRQLWNLIKQVVRGNTQTLFRDLATIRSTTGFTSTVLALVSSLPNRVRSKFRSKS